MLAKKGILASNPDVEKMSEGQWVAEFYAIRTAELEELKAHRGMLKSLLVSLLGLNLRPPRDDEGNLIIEPTQQDLDEAITPLAIFASSPEMLKIIAEDFEALKLLREGLQTPSEDYEKQFQAGLEFIKNGNTAGIDPILLQDPKKVKWNSKQMQDDLARLLSPPPPPPAGEPARRAKVKFD